LANSETSWIAVEKEVYEGINQVLIRKGVWSDDSDEKIKR